MNTNSGNDRSEDRLGSMVAVGLSIGAGFGVALGLVFDNLALGIAIGAGMGMAIGASFGGRNLVGGGEKTAGRGWLAVLVGIGLILLLVATGVGVLLALTSR